MDDKRTLVTTSWDDAHPLDLRLAERLAVHGLRGTFYVPIAYGIIPRMSVEQIRDLRAMGMEIGSHTVTHPRLTEVSQADVLKELRDSKDMLQQMLGEEVQSFCYPEGKFHAGLRSLVRQAGYLVGRTTIPFRTDFNFDPLAMPVTFQLLEHSRGILSRHAIGEGNYSGFWRWVLRYHCQRDLVRLTSAVLDQLQHTGGVLHLWGHSWELERDRLWDLLECILEMLANHRRLIPVNNAELVEAPVYA